MIAPPPTKQGEHMEPSGVVYVATNKIDGRKYVGQTIKGLKERVRVHFKERPGIPFSEDLKKYGTDGFVFEQIMYSASSLDEWERYFIKKLNTLHPNGYNLTEGGKRDYRCSEEYSKRNARGQFGKVLSEEHKEKLRKYAGANHHCYGKKLSDETKEKISQARLRFHENRRRMMNEFITNRGICPLSA